MARSAAQAKNVRTAVNVSVAAGGIGVAPRFRLATYYQDINNAAANVAAFEAMVGRPVGTHAFLGSGDMTKAQCLADGANKIAILNNLSQGIYLFTPTLMVTGMTLEDVAAGVHDDHILAMAQLIKTARPDKRGKWVVRPFHEFNDASHPHYAIGKASVLVTAWRRAIGIFRSVDTNFEFHWCPNMLDTVGLFTDYYPGRPYVDYCGYDLYLITRPTGLPNLTADILDGWNYKKEYIGDNLDAMSTFADTENLLIILGETGQDNKYARFFLESKFDWSRDHPRVVMLVEWDKNIVTGNPQFNMKQSDLQYPDVYAAYSIQAGPTLSILDGPNGASYKASKSHSTVIPIATNKGGRMDGVFLVGAAPPGVSIVNEGILVDASAPQGSLSVRARVMDMQGDLGEKEFTIAVQAGALADWAPNSWFGSSLRLWYDVIDYSSLTFVSSTKLVTIGDKSNNGHIGRTAGSDTNKPTYTADAGDGKPGFPLIPANFQAISVDNPATLPYGGQARTIVGQFYWNAPAGSFQSLLGWCDDSNNVAGLIESRPRSPAADAFGRFNYTPVPGGHKTSYFKTTARHLGFIIEQDAVDVVDGLCWVRVTVNGVRQRRQKIAPSAIVPTILKIGGTPTTTSISARADATLREFMILDRVLTPLERLLVPGYLAQRWARAADLLPTHPFKTIAPKMIV